MKRSYEILFRLIGNALFFVTGLLFIWFRNNAELQYGNIYCIIFGTIVCIVCGLGVHNAIDEWRKLRKVDIREIDEFWCSVFVKYLNTDIMPEYAELVNAIGGKVILAAYHADNATLEKYLSNASSITRLCAIDNNSVEVDAASKYASNYDGTTLHDELLTHISL